MELIPREQLERMDALIIEWAQGVQKGVEAAQPAMEDAVKAFNGVSRSFTILMEKENNVYINGWMSKYSDSTRFYGDEPVLDLRDTEKEKARKRSHDDLVKKRREMRKRRR